MRITQFRSCCLSLFVVFGMQSLADVAREEAERRKQLELQGIVGKVVEGNSAHLTREADLNASTTSPETPKRSRTPAAKNQTSVRSFPAALQKLDRAIRQEEARLESRRARLQAERWAIPKVGRVSSRSRASDRQERLQEEIEDLQAKLKQLRQERAEIYEEGKKAGFLPGELDGKGIVP